VLHGVLPDRVVRVHDEMRPIYQERFGQQPLHCEIVALTVLAERWVVAHERVLSPTGEVELVGVFEVADGAIVRTDMTARHPVAAGQNR
jgi:hypothetical protein